MEVIGFIVQAGLLLFYGPTFQIKALLQIFFTSFLRDPVIPPTSGWVNNRQEIF
jgi:hypothetical protein